MIPGTRGGPDAATAAALYCTAASAEAVRAASSASPGRTPPPPARHAQPLRRCTAAQLAIRTVASAAPKQLLRQDALGAIDLCSPEARQSPVRPPLLSGTDDGSAILHDVPYAAVVAPTSQLQVPQPLFASGSDMAMELVCTNPRPSDTLL